MTMTDKWFVPDQSKHQPPPHRGNGKTDERLLEYQRRWRAKNKDRIRRYRENNHRRVDE